MTDFIPKQEAVIEAGLPMISFMRSLTGDQYEVYDLWKGNLQDFGYQTPEFYDAMGMTQD